MTNDDLELIQRYVEQRSEEAFTALVQRHLNLVYAAALRQVRSPELAKEVAQTVFTDLAQTAGRLKPKTILTAWLYQVTRRTAIDVVRRESRRQRREQIAVQLVDMNANDSDWEQIAPLLDEAMEALDNTDRTAVLLRYFENKSLREVGQSLGTSDDAAQKRVSRAVERLRQFFAGRSIEVGASGLVVVISANAVPVAPVGLTMGISAAVLSGTVIQTSTAIAATKTIVMTTLQKTFIGSTLAVAVGTGVYQGFQASHWRDQAEALRQQQSNVLQEWQREREAQSKQIAAISLENERLNSNTTELLKLRGEVGRLRGQERELAKLRAAAAANAPDAPPLPINIELSKDSWRDAGFATPEAALKTRGWAVVNANRERFKESMFITEGAREILLGMFRKMVEANPGQAQFWTEQGSKNNWGVEEGFLMPMVAENRDKGYASYRILSQQGLSPDEMMFELETQMVSAPAKKESVKMQRFGNDWKFVIDENFVKQQMEKVGGK